MNSTPPSPEANRQPEGAAGLRAAHGSATVGGWWVFRLDKHDHAKIGDYWAGPFLNKYQADEWMKKQTWPNQLIVGRPAIICDESPNDQAQRACAKDQ